MVTMLFQIVSMHYWKTYIFQVKFTAYSFFVCNQSFTVTRVFEIEGNEQLQVKMVHLYFIDEVIILSVIHNDILHL